jgi:DNA-binding HxlR family transcriptional regulator
MSTADLAPLFHHRWSAPVLAELARRRGSRFAALVGELGVGRESLRRTLDALVDQGLVRRNPGYGHPLRPEYVLTPDGGEVAARCTRLLAALDGDRDVALKKWSMPVVAALDRPRRFSELREALPGVTPRALALALKDLHGVGLLERRLEDSYPPTAVYVPTARSAALRGILVAP